MVVGRGGAKRAAKRPQQRAMNVFRKDRGAPLVAVDGKEKKKSSKNTRTRGPGKRKYNADGTRDNRPKKKPHF